MNRSALVRCEMHTSLPATLEAMEEFFVEFRRRSRGLLDEGSCFAAELLVREALANAVIHGCHADPSKQVRCFLRLKDRRLLIAIDNDGDGFDWRAALRTSASFSDCSGRGIEILRRYANRVRYSTHGNLVTIIKRF